MRDKSTTTPLRPTRADVWRSFFIGLVIGVALTKLGWLEWLWRPL